MSKTTDNKYTIILNNNKQKLLYFLNILSLSRMKVSTSPFCTGMSVAISIESSSALITVGPNTIPTLLGNILLIWPYSHTLKNPSTNNMENDYYTYFCKWSIKALRV